MVVDLNNYLGGPAAIESLLAQLVPSPPKQDELRIGDLEVRMVKNTDEIAAAQALRYHVFYEELFAQPTAEMAASKRDFDDFDAICDHMVVVDHAQQDPAQQIVGTYRLLRRSMLKPGQQFYTAGEFDISALLQHEGELLEVGRSCVSPKYRTRQTLDLLWRGIAAYVLKYDAKLIFGCASFPGTDPEKLRDVLGYLYTHHLAPPALRPVALPERYIQMADGNGLKLSPKQAMQQLPPLIKGYLRLGGFIGDGAIIDQQWGSIDVAIVVKTDLITGKYAKHLDLIEL